MSPKITRRMAEQAKSRGAKVEPIKKVQKPPPPRTPVMTNKAPDTGALEKEITELKAEVAKMRKVAQANSQELIGVLTKASEDKPLRLKPIRDMDRNSPTYLLVEYYDFVPVTYRKLNS